MRKIPETNWHHNYTSKGETQELLLIYNTIPKSVTGRDARKKNPTMVQHLLRTVADKCVWGDRQVMATTLIMVGEAARDDCRRGGINRDGYCG